MIPVNEPRLLERDVEYVSECVRTGWISSAGRFISEFEEGFAAYCGRRHGIAVSNGTAALQLAIASLGLKPGDEIIMPTFTIMSCAMAVVYNDGVPVLVDSDPRTWCMDVEQVKDRITPRTRAIMPVHIYGHPVDMDPIMELAGKHGLAVIEDAAEAHGAEYLCARDTADAKWRRCGGFGEMSCFSFYANKAVTTGEGGMVLADDDELADKARSLRNLCFQRSRRFYHEELGFWDSRSSSGSMISSLASAGRARSTPSGSGASRAFSFRLKSPGPGASTGCTGSCSRTGSTWMPSSWR
jgi:perosamine synthetase